MTEQQPEQIDYKTPDTEAAGEQLVLTSPEEARTAKELALWAGVILLAALTIYSVALRGDFLWDDDRHVSRNPNLRDLPGLVNIWTKFGVPAGGTVQYYPLTHTTFWLEYQLSGARPGAVNTTVFHVTNVVLHVIGAILLWLVLRELKVPGAWIAAAIWALHPLQVESVAWISERKNVLAGVFFFGAIWAYIKAAGIGAAGIGDRGSGIGNAEADAATSSSPDPIPDTRYPIPASFSARLYWLALALFVCALLSKSVTVSMPAVALLLIWWKRGKVTARDLGALAPFFVLGIGMAALTTWMERTQVGARGAEWEAISFPQRILIAGRAIWFYVQKNLVPVRLAFIYPRWNLAQRTATWWLFPAGVVAVAAVLLALARKIGRGPLVAWLIFCGVLVPALGFIDFYPMRYSFVADHFQYLASPALIALVVAAVTVLMRRMAANASAAPYVIAGLVLVVLSALSLMQARVYGGPLLLWDDAIRKNPDSPMLRYNYGVDLSMVTEQLPPQEAQPFVEEAARQFESAVKLDPRHDRAWARWGGALIFLNKHEEALEKFDEALRLRPDNVDALGGRGRALHELKRYDDARAAFEAALATANAQRGTGAITRSSVAAIHQYLGRIAVAQNDLETATRHYAESVGIVNDNAQTRYEYGVVLARQGKLLDGGATTRAATQSAATQVAVATATTSPATTRSATQPSKEAEKLLLAAAQQLGAAISIRPDFVDARVALANLMMDVGNITGANTQLAAALRASGGNPSAELKAAVERWDAEFRKREAATRPATGPATTQATPSPATPATRLTP